MHEAVLQRLTEFWLTRIRRTGENDDMALGNRIRQLRQSCGLTQSQLGGTELSKGFISLLEKGRARPSMETLVLLARRLNTSVDALLGQQDHRPELVGEGLLSLSHEAIRARDFERARTLLAAADYVAAHYGVDEAVREGRLQSAHIAMEQRRFDDALQTVAMAEQACVRAHDLWRRGRCLLLRGMVKVRQRDVASAIADLQQALVVLRQARAGRDPARVETLITLGTALGMRGDYVGAIRRFEEAAAAQVTRHDAVLRGKALWGAGLAHRKAGNLDVAGRYLREARDAFESAEELHELMNVLQNLGQLLFDQGQPKEALRYFHQALRVMERLQQRTKLASVTTEIARVQLHLGNLEEAEHFARQALDVARSVSDPMEVAEAIVLLARIAHRRHESDSAIRLYKDALSTFQRHQMAAKVAEVARELGLLLRMRGAHAQAARYLAMAVEAGQTGEAVIAEAD